MKQIKLLLTFLISLVMGTKAWSAVGTEFWAKVDGDIQAEFKVLTEEGTTGTVELIAYNNAAQTVNISPTVSRVVSEVTYTYTITSIGNNAFNTVKAKANLQSCTLPSTITSIGEQAFYQCSKLRSINIPAGVTSIPTKTFYECTLLAAVTFDEGSQLTTIGNNAFRKCKFEEIMLPNTVTTIDNEAFRLCSSLKTINFPPSLTMVNYAAFYGCGFESLTLPASVTTWGQTVFAGCSSLTSVTFPEGMTEIPGSMVSSCESLTSVTIPASVTTIGSWAFQSCTSLSSVTFAENSNLTSIGALAFNGCTALNSISIPEGVTTLGDEIFAGCNSLSSITLPSTLTAIPEKFAYCSDGVNPPPLTQVNIPTGVTSIGNMAFYHCTNLQPVILPEGLVTIGEEAFYDCLKFKEITIPSTVESIGGGAFLRKYSYQYGGYDYAYKLLDKVTCLATIPPALGYKESYFYSAGPFIGSETLVLPENDNVVKAYATSSWGNYFFIPMTFVVDGVTYRTINQSCVQVGDGQTAAISTSATEFTIPETINYEGKTYYVRSIASNAFVDCTQLTTLTSELPDAPSLSENAFDVSMAENCTLVLPETSGGYDSWWQYFKEVYIPKTPRVFIMGVPYTAPNYDLFGDGKVSLTWEMEEYNMTPTNAPRKSLKKQTSAQDEYLYQNGVPVLTLQDGANINFAGEGPAIEAYSDQNRSFYIRVLGTASITASNADAVISIGTCGGEIYEKSGSSLVILNDGDNPDATLQLTITNNSASGGDGVFIYWGSFNVQNCAVNISAPGYALSYYYEDVSSGEWVDAPRHNAEGGPKKVTPVNGPVDAEEYYGWLNIYEGSQLTLNGGEAALWGATGTYEYSNGYIYYPGYLQNTGLLDSDKSEYISNPNYTAIEGPLFYPAGQNGYSGSYYVGCEKSNKDYDIFPCKYLKFGRDCFTISNPESVPLTYKIVGDGEVQLGTGQPMSFSNYISGRLTIPGTVTYNGTEYTVKKIAQYAFNTYYAEEISEIIIPASITEIGYYAFGGIENLQSVSVFSKTPPTMNDYSFNDVAEYATLYVPKDCGAAYVESNWCRFGDIKEMVFIMAPTVEGVYMSFELIDEDAKTVKTIDGYWNSNTYSYNIAIPNNYSGPITIPSIVTDADDVSYTVTNIGMGSFYESGITSVVLPNTVSIIGSYAFEDCANLNSVTCQSTVPPTLICSEYNGEKEYPFSWIPATCKLYVPEGLIDTYKSEEDWSNCFQYIREIGDTSFGPGDTFFADNGEGVNMNFFVTGTNPNTVQTYGYDRENPENHYWESVPAIDKNFSGHVAIPRTVTYNDVVYTVTEIGYNSFNECRGVTSFSIPNTVTAIGADAFYCCTGITSAIDIPEGVTSIGVCAFGNCIYMPTLHIPSTVTEIGTRAFYSCPYLNTITVDPANTVYDSRNNCNAVIETATNKLVVGSNNTVIPDGITVICEAAFDCRSSLQSVTLPEGLTTIEEAAFYYCSSLTSINIPNTVTSIGWNAFNSCTGLTAVTIPNSVNSISNYAFNNCTNITEVTAEAVTPPSLSYRCFYQIGSNPVLNVPYGCLNKYQTSDWAQYFSTINMINDKNADLATIDADDDYSVTFTEDLTDGSGEALDLEDAVAGGVYYNLNSADGEGFDTDEGCIVINNTISEEAMQNIVSQGFDSESRETIANQYSGLIVQVNGKGTIEIVCKTLGTGQLTVRVGNGDPIPYTSQDENTPLVVGFDVTEPTLIYIYASDMAVSSSVKGYRLMGRRRVGDTPEDPGASVMIYKLSVEEHVPVYNIEIGGQMVTGQNADDFEYYGLNSGAIYFDPATYTLTLSNVDMEEGIIKINGFAADEDVQHLTINLEGNNFLKTNENVFYVWGVDDQPYTDITITSQDGSGSLTTFMPDLDKQYWSEEEGTWLCDEWIIGGNWVMEGAKSLTISQCKVITGEIGVENVTVQKASTLEAIIERDVVTCGNGIGYLGRNAEGRDVYGLISKGFLINIGTFGVATFCSTQPLNFAKVENVKAYIATGFDPATNQLTLTRVLDVPAGTGLLLWNVSGGEVSITIPIEAAQSSYENNMFVGCMTDTYVLPEADGYTNFVLSKHLGDDFLGFYRFTTNNPDGRLIEAGKAYLQIPTNQLNTGGGIKGFSFVFDDDPTAISVINNEQSVMDGNIYNLAGQRLNKAQKGINIVNGKKVLVK